MKMDEVHVRKNGKLKWVGCCGPVCDHKRILNQTEWEPRLCIARLGEAGRFPH
jgi:hypothetical protein